VGCVLYSALGIAHLTVFTLQWHPEISGLTNALNTPVGAMANLLPPHLLVAQMLEPVKVHASRAVVHIIA
jgi:hypothetical protein